MRQDVCVNTHPRELNPWVMLGACQAPKMREHGGSLKADVEPPRLCLEVERLGAPCAVAIWTTVHTQGVPPVGGRGCLELGLLGLHMGRICMRGWPLVAGPRLQQRQKILGSTR